MITVTSLRKIFTEQGIKGASKWTRLEFDTAILTDWFAADEEDATRNPAAPEFELAAAPKKGICGICGNRRSYTGKGAGVETAPQLSDMCNFCFTEGGWENTHSDEAHQTGTVGDCEGCWICFPELNLVHKPIREGRSRLGMVIVAKGSEIHKSMVLKAAAEAIGWTVEIERETYELADDATGEGTRYYATATRGEDSISLAWDGRRYDYPSSSARIGGKDRKVRNLKEALRLLAA